MLRDFGIRLDIRHLYRGDEVPTDLDEVRTLIVLGGPMGVGDVGKPEFPFLARELDLLKRAVMIDRAVLGICLGAQLLAHAAGAKVYPNTRPGGKPEEPAVSAPEFGWGPVTFPFPGGAEPIVMGMHDGMYVLHWHYDTLDLPRLPSPANPAPPPAPPPPSGNALLSSSRLCKNQAFRFKNRLFGFQYHFEVEVEDVERWLEVGKADVVKVLGPDGPDQIRRDTRTHHRELSRLGDKLLKNFVQFLKVY